MPETPVPRLRPTWVEVDLDAIAHNTRRLKQIVGPSVALMAVVKADGYGHGAAGVARTALAHGASHLAVANLEEAVALREAGISAPCLILSYVEPSAVALALHHDLTLTVYDPELAGAYSRAALAAGARLRVHIKVDTGMGRLGLLVDDACQGIADMQRLPGLEIEGLYTHYASADEDLQATAEQTRQFRAVIDALAAAEVCFRCLHAANSAAVLAAPETHFDLVRVGLALYGLSPSETVPVPPDFRPALAWKTVVASVKTLPAGHGVGYGSTYVTQTEERIAVIPVGYADGLRRAPQHLGEVLVRGQRAPIVGRVSMEKTMIDVTHIDDVRVGDEVVLLGAQGGERIRAEEIAARLGTINYEVVCTTLPRVPRLTTSP